MIKRFLFVLTCLFVIGGTSAAQTTSFTYQGKLTTSGTPATGNFDFELRLFDAASGGAQQGTTQTLLNVAVANGIFTVQLDFGACASCFNGAARFLDITVRQAGGGAFTPLAPRQPLTSTPYAIKSLNATAADGLSLACVNCVTSSQIQSVAGSAVSGTIPVASVPDLSTTYIKNATAQQAASNFNISGQGTADIFNAATQFNLGGNRILSNAGTDNLFAGQRAGELNSGTFNAFFGRDAGRFNTAGSSNTFVGGDAGFNNDQGGNNVYVGTSAGFNSFGALANGNTFVGASAGGGNTSGRGNTMVGFQADVALASGIINATAIGQRALVTQSNALVLGSINGVNNATADTNVGIGTTAPTERLHVVGNGLFTGTLNAGLVNATTQYNFGGQRVLSVSGEAIGLSLNTFVGIGAGFSNTPGPGGQGINNSFFGNNAGQLNTTGSDNSFFGTTAGKNNTTGFANSIFGTVAGFANTTGFGNSFFGSQAGGSNTTGTSNSFFGQNAGLGNTTGGSNAFFGQAAGYSNTTGGNNSFFGSLAGQNNTTGMSNTFIGQNADFTTSNSTGHFNTLLGFSTQVTSGVSNATAIGHRAQVTQSHSLILGAINNVNGCIPANNCDSVNVGIGTTAPAFKLQVIDPSNTGLRVQTNTAGGTVASFGGVGDFQIDASGVAGGRFIVKENGNVGISTNSPTDKLVVNGGFLRLNSLGVAGSTTLCLNGSNQISTCSSSRQYKTNIATLHTGLSLIDRLRPVTFDWKQSGQHDLGLVAEEVAEVEPLLVTHNDKGEIEGVKYDRVGVVLINAVKEQQAQIEGQQKQLAEREHQAALQQTQIRQDQQQLAAQQTRLAEQGAQLALQQREIDALKRLLCHMHPRAEVCKAVRQKR